MRELAARPRKGTAGSPTRETLSQQRRHLATLCAAAAAVCVSKFEDATASAVAEALADAKQRIADSFSLLESILATHGNPKASYMFDEQTESGGWESEVPAEMGGLPDVVALAAMGLRSRQRTLEALGPAAAQWECLAALASAMRAVQKSLGAVDRVLARTCESEVTFDFYAANVAISLEVRSLYLAFHAAVKQSAPPTVHDVVGRLRALRGHITQLLSRPIAMHLRVGDRALLVLSKTRIQKWLNGDMTEALHLAEGLRLYQDTANVATMFLDVNKREELVRHDALLARDVLVRLPLFGEWHPEERRAAFEKLGAMSGRSAALDALLSRPTDASLEALRSVLHQTHAALSAAVELEDAQVSAPRFVDR